MTRAGFRYRACGLSIDADAAIQGARQIDADGAVDVRIRMHGHHTASSPADRASAPFWYRSPYDDTQGRPLLTVQRIGASFFFCYSEGTHVLVNDAGSEIDAWWDPPLTAADAADYLLGGILAFVVRRRGMLPLHASAVVLDGRAVLFAGAAGAGKSSTAAAFAALGVPVLSDDVVTMAVRSDGVVAHSSHPRVSIWSDSAAGLFAGRTLPAHSPVYAKQRLDLIDCGLRFHDSAAPVVRIFVLSDRAADRRRPAIDPLSARAGLMELVTHSYGNYLLDAPMRASEFELLGRIATSARVERLSFGEGFETLVANCRQLVSRVRS